MEFHHAVVAGRFGHGEGESKVFTFELPMPDSDRIASRSAPHPGGQDGEAMRQLFEEVQQLRTEVRNLRALRDEPVNHV